MKKIAILFLAISMIFSGSSSAQIIASRASAKINVGGSFGGTETVKAVIDIVSVNGLTVSVNGDNSTDPSGNPLTYIWSFGDDTPAVYYPSTDHVYENSGTYTIGLTVKSDLGRNTTTVEVTVTAPPPDDTDTLTMITYNVPFGSMPDSLARLDDRINKLVDLIVQNDADIVCLQEMERNNSRVNNIDQPVVLLQKLAARGHPMYGQYGARRSYYGGEFGNMVLSRWPIQNYENIYLAYGQGFREYTQTFKVTTPEGNQFRVFNYHPTPRDSASTVNILETKIALYPNDMKFLLGDFNAALTNPLLNDIRVDFYNSNELSSDPSTRDTVDDTFHPGAGIVAIDHVWFQKGVNAPYTAEWQLVNAFSPHSINTEDLAVSDHYPLVAMLRYSLPSGE